MAYEVPVIADEFSFGAPFGGASSKIAKELLSLEPSAIIELYKIYPDRIKNPSFYLNLHNGSNFGGPIFWQGQEYLPAPIEIEGIENDSKGGINRPTIRISNYYNGNDRYFSALLEEYDDFKSAEFIRKRTFLRFLDDVNFESAQNPFGKQDFSAQISEETFVVSQKISENKMIVEFELTSPLDRENTKNTSRRIMAKHCPFDYRGLGCGYTGKPRATEKGDCLRNSDGKYIPQGRLYNKGIWLGSSSYNQGDYVRVYSGIPYSYSGSPAFNSGVALSDSPKVPIYYVAKKYSQNKDPISNPDFWDKDGCSKQLCACMDRFRYGTVPFGGFIQTNKYQFNANV